MEQLPFSKHDCVVGPAARMLLRAWVRAQYSFPARGEKLHFVTYSDGDREPGRPASKPKLTVRPHSVDAIANCANTAACHQLAAQSAASQTARLDVAFMQRAVA
jgi:hypothetical protein